MKINKELDLVYYTFAHFDKTGLVRHGFSTRLGGVSRKQYHSLNLGFSRGDLKDNVLTNFGIFCEALDIKTDDLVFSAQTHTTNVMKAVKAHRGNGIARKNAFIDVDGFITNESNTALVTFYADCVPVFLLDPNKKAIGLCHAGWKGTLNKIAENAVNLMKAEYGTNPGDLLAGIAPSIGPCCFETDESVYSLFEEKGYGDNFIKNSDDKKKHIDLWEINKDILINCGINPGNIDIAAVCTKCNPDIFFSHRKHGVDRGSLAAILELK